MFKYEYLLWEVVSVLFSRIWKVYYYTEYIDKFADISYGYAITIYKSQGSTYPIVYIGLPNILSCMKVDSSIRMKALYTAISRASLSVTLYGKDNILYPLSNQSNIKCINCNMTKNSLEYYLINLTICSKCCDKILSKINRADEVSIENRKYAIDKNKYFWKDAVFGKINPLESYQYSNIKIGLKYLGNMTQ